MSLVACGDHPACIVALLLVLASCQFSAMIDKLLHHAGC